MLLSSDEEVVDNTYKDYFPVPNAKGRPVVRAVDGVSFTLRRGEVMGLVGESGSGKSTVGRLILRLHEPTEGRVLFDGAELGALGRRELRHMRRRMQMIFQDPYSSLNPYMRVRDILLEALAIHRLRAMSAGATAARTSLPFRPPAIS